MNVRVIEVTRNETDWTALVSADGQTPIALSFPAGARPTDEEIRGAAAAVYAKPRVADQPPEAADIPVETKVEIVANLVGKISYPLTAKPTEAEIRAAIERDSAK